MACHSTVFVRGQTFTNMKHELTNLSQAGDHDSEDNLKLNQT